MKKIPQNVGNITTLSDQEDSCLESSLWHSKKTCVSWAKCLSSTDFKVRHQVIKVLKELRQRHMSNWTRSVWRWGDVEVGWVSSCQGLHTEEKIAGAKFLWWGWVGQWVLQMKEAQCKMLGSLPWPSEDTFLPELGRSSLLPCRKHCRFSAFNKNGKYVFVWCF